MTTTSLESPQSQIKVSHHWARSILPPLLIALLAFAVRVPHVGRLAFELDEVATLEISSGRGMAHQSLPMNVVFEGPELMRLAGAPPWWRIWTRMECAYPPLYSVLLRWWEDVFGDGDTAVRMLSVLASAIAVALLYDVARLLNGTSVAIWASILMALSQPQISYAREARAYALLLVVALIVADVLVRIQIFGFTRRRCLILCAAILLTLLTHYFCIGAMAALALYALIRLSGPARTKTIAAFVGAAVIFILIWGPFMWRQRTLFSTSDAGTQFLRNDGPDHIHQTLWQLVLIPTRLLAEPRGNTAGICAITAVIFILPFGLLRRQPNLLLWSLWLVGVVALIAGMDLFRKTNQLLFIRYTLLAGPALYVLIPGIFSAVFGRTWLWHILPAAAVVSCALAFPEAYLRYETDTHIIVHDLTPMIGRNDLIVFAASGETEWTAAAQYLMVSRYLQPLQCPVAILNEPASGQVLARARASRNVVVFTNGQPGATFIPGSKLIEERWYFGRGILWRLDPNPRQ